MWHAHDARTTSYEPVSTWDILDVRFDGVRVMFTVDPTTALTAPVTELVVFTLKEGKTADMIVPDLDVLAAQDTKTVISSSWGRSIDDARRFVMLVGWESLKVSMFPDDRHGRRADNFAGARRRR